MVYFSSFWLKHYQKLRSCCMTEPLIRYPFIKDNDKKVPPDLQNKLIRDLIDVGWMSDKGLKWFGWDVNGWYAWTDANGMIYRIRDLKRNEDGKRFEKEVTKIIRVDEPRNDIRASANELYQHEFNLCVDCQLCPDRSGVSDSDTDTNTSTDGGGGEKEEEINVTAPPWQSFTGGGITDYAAIHGGNGTGYDGGSPNYGGQGDSFTDYTPPTATPTQTVYTGDVTDTSTATGDGNPPAIKGGGKTTAAPDVAESPAAPNNEEPIKGIVGGKENVIIETENKIIKYTPNVPQIKYKTPNIPNILPTFQHSRDTTIFVPPPPVTDCDDNINQLWSFFKNSNITKVDNPKGFEDFTIKELIPRIKADRIGKPKIKYYVNKPTQGMLYNKIYSINGEKSTITDLTDGDIKQAAISKTHLISFIAALFHEHIHDLQKMKLDLDGDNNHDEREVMAHMFNLFPDEFFNWLNTNYPGKIPTNFKYCYPTYNALYTLQQYIHDFVMYYKRLPEVKKRKYRYFFNKVHYLNMRYRSSFVDGNFMPDMTTLNE